MTATLNVAARTLTTPDGLVALRRTPTAILADLGRARLREGYLSAERGDPKPGGNHSRAYHHGWRMRMMDFRELPIPDEHRRLVNDWVERERIRRANA